jgi:hypothetical protein
MSNTSNNSSGKTTTTNDPVKTSGVSSGIRISTALVVGVILGLSILVWDSNILPHGIMPDWIGGYVFIPMLSVVLGYGICCLVQQLSCGQVQWLIQLQRVSILPVPFIVVKFVLYMMPSLRWPIEGLIQSVSPELRTGLSSAFYTFWTGLYCQSMLNSVSQLCPK